MKGPEDLKPKPIGLPGYIFFDVPVYRLSREKYETAQENYVSKENAEASDDCREYYCRSPAAKADMEAHLRLAYGGPWLFNEIVGYIRLYFLGTQVRGEYWRVNKKHVVRSRTKVMAWRHWKVTHEEETPPKGTSRVVFACIKKYLERAQAEIAPRFIDTSVLESIGPFVNWSSLLEVSQQVKPARQSGIRRRRISPGSSI